MFPIGVDTSSMGNARPILVTAFGPFGGRRTNASSIALQLLRRSDRSLRTRTFPVDRVEAPRRLAQAVKRVHPRAIVLLGEAGNAGRIRLESRAWNQLDFGIPDIRGRQPRGEAIVPEGPEFLETRLPLELLHSRLTAAGHDVEISTDPGRYLCNLLFHQALHHHAVPSIFVHLPLENRIDPERAVDALRDLIAEL